MTLILAVPSKGRLQENTYDYFARAGLDIAQGRGVRDYRGAIAGLPGVEVAFLSVSEIVGQLASGAVHIGVVGEDLVREQIGEGDSRLVLLTPLGFGHANVVVAAPQSWIDVRNMADLEDVAAHYRARRGERMRVATKYVNLTRRFFNEHGVGDYRIVESLGATEGAPASGSAELIVDITTTGATLVANALKIIEDGVILRSEANLAASIKADWTPEARGSARIILSRLAASEKARRSREVRAFLPERGQPIVAEAAEKYAATAEPTNGTGGEIAFLAPRDKAAELADFLLSRGAKRVCVRAVEQVFETQNPLYNLLAAKVLARA